MIAILRQNQKGQNRTNMVECHTVCIGDCHQCEEHKELHCACVHLSFLENAMLFRFVCLAQGRTSFHDREERKGFSQCGVHLVFSVT